MNRDLAQGDRIPSGKPVDPSDTSTPAPTLNTSKSEKGAPELKPDEFRLGGDEEALRYGIGAREEFGAAHPTWTSELEQKLQSDWLDAFDSPPKPKRDWSQVQRQVRHAYEHKRDHNEKPHS